MNHSESILAVQQLSVNYHTSGLNISILEDLNFEVFPGRIFGIIGESGSGKTMTGMSLMGLADFYQGITVLGNVRYKSKSFLATDTTEWAKIRGKSIAYILQQPTSALNPVLRIGAQVAESLSLHHSSIFQNDIKHQVTELLVRVGLNDSERIYMSYPHELSGGQLQRVVIAMAIAHQPDVIIADEVTSSLDASTAYDILRLILSYQKQNNTTFIFISHDLSQVMEMCDHVMYLEHGKIVDQFCPKDGDSALKPKTKSYLEALQYYSPRSKSMEGGEMRLVLRDVKKVFRSESMFFWNKPKETLVLDGINLELRAGQMLGVLGESGSGKTTLGKIIAGIIDSTSGLVEYNGQSITKDILEDNVNLRKKIQWVAQDTLSSLDPSMTIGEQWTEVAIFHGLVANKKEAREYLLNLMVTYGLPIDVYDKYPSQISGGQMQRASLLRTLLLSPELIIFDESLSALDYYNQQKLILLIIELQETLNFSGIFISHDTKLVKSMCHKVILLDKGKVVKHGNTMDVLG